MPFFSLELEFAIFFFLVKGQVVTILGFEGQMVSVSTTQLCHCSAKAARDEFYIK